jgi:hypothetical protein
MIPADGVAPAEYLFVRPPALADLSGYLLLDGREGGLVYTADPGGLVLDPEQDTIPVLDGLL